jgi:hypothetical protein
MQEWTPLYNLPQWRVYKYVYMFTSNWTEWDPFPICTQVELTINVRRVLHTHAHARHVYVSGKRQSLKQCRPVIGHSKRWNVCRIEPRKTCYQHRQFSFASTDVSNTFSVWLRVCLSLVHMWCRFIRAYSSNQTDNLYATVLPYFWNILFIETKNFHFLNILKVKNLFNHALFQ